MLAYRRGLSRSLIVAAVAASVQLTALPAAISEPTPSPGASMPAGLRLAAVGSCAGSFQVGHSKLCSHGPDPIPLWIRERGGPKIERAQTSVTSATAVTAAATVGCDGDGVSGKRVQAIYAHVAGRSNRLSTWSSSMRSWAGDVDTMFGQSAQETGGTARLRWVTANCQLDIVPVALSSAAEVNFDTMLNELAALGHNRNDRKYLVWFDSNPQISSMCGLGTIWMDDRPSADNFSNQFVGYARVDYQCWDFAEGHELMHNLGGVQLSAPHSSGGWHCTDENDQMCYQDGPNVVMTYPCADQAHSGIFDCRHDDYFDTDPEVGGYLADHWNTARSDWIVGGELDSVPVDGVAPTVGIPTASFVSPQTVYTTALMRVYWPASSDESGIAAYELQRKKGTGSWLSVTLLAPTATSADLALVVGATYAFRVRARDAAGNTGAWTVLASAKLNRYEETAAAITYVNTFKRVALAGASAGYVRKTGVAGRKARLTFTGSAVAFVSTIAQARGIAAISIDGAALQSISLYNPTTRTRQVVWAAAVAQGTHVVEVTVTGGREPNATSIRVDVDAFLTR